VILAGVAIYLRAYGYVSAGVEKAIEILSKQKNGQQSKGGAKSGRLQEQEEIDVLNVKEL